MFKQTRGRGSKGRGQLWLGVEGERVFTKQVNIWVCVGLPICGWIWVGKHLAAFWLEVLDVADLIFLHWQGVVGVVFWKSLHQFTKGITQRRNLDGHIVETEKQDCDLSMKASEDVTYAFRLSL